MSESINVEKIMKSIRIQVNENESKNSVTTKNIVSIASQRFKDLTV